MKGMVSKNILANYTMISIPIKLKVCGMKYAENLKELVALDPDYIGFIFYPQSPRYMATSLTQADLQLIPPHIKKTGVFVNADVETIRSTARKFQLDALQLHGNESPEMCKTLKAMGYEIIKVFGIGHVDFDFHLLEPYKPHVDYFLFDTKSKNYGGTGKTFKWEVLQNYDLDIPFFLSGGVNLENISQIQSLKNLNIYAIDVNSQFETTPGQKDIVQLKKLKLLFQQ